MKGSKTVLRPKCVKAVYYSVLVIFLLYINAVYFEDFHLLAHKTTLLLFEDTVNSPFIYASANFLSLAGIEVVIIGLALEFNTHLFIISLASSKLLYTLTIEQNLAVITRAPSGEEIAQLKVKSTSTKPLRQYFDRVGFAFPSFSPKKTFYINKNIKKFENLKIYPNKPMI